MGTGVGANRAHNSCQRKTHVLNMCVSINGFCVSAVCFCCLCMFIKMQTGCLSIFCVMYEGETGSVSCENECTFGLSVFLPCVKWAAKLADLFVCFAAWDVLCVRCIRCIMWKALCTLQNWQLWSIPDICACIQMISIVDIASYNITLC